MSSSDIKSSETQQITVTWTGSGHECTLSFRGRTMRCSLGTNGVTNSKVEGDSCTPAGSFLLRQVFWRADRLPAKPDTGGLQNVTSVLRPTDGWCDGPTSPEYNQQVTLPYNYSHEILWERDENFYDLFSVIGYNDNPVVPGAGSAIFFHTTTQYGSTAGCVALSLSDLEWVLAGVEADTLMVIS
jgi:L,D-peptidoglycan transpeptidase YkuD (ErfK/YbiS/YcfS/YnhG family)